MDQKMPKFFGNYQELHSFIWYCLKPALCETVGQQAVPRTQPKSILLGKHMNAFTAHKITGKCITDGD